MSFDIFTSPSHFGSCLDHFKSSGPEYEIEVLEIIKKSSNPMSPRNSKLIPTSKSDKIEDMDLIKFSVRLN
jgi:hypothetical protein